MHRIRSLGIALVVLGLSAGVVFAARALPSASTTGLAHASQMSGQQVPVRGANGDEPEQAASPSPSPSPSIGAAATPEPQASEHPDNHGKIVSEAAHKSLAQINAALPAGQTPFRNHGAYVSSVARSGHGTSHGPVASPGPGQSHQPETNDSGS